MDVRDYFMEKFYTGVGSRNVTIYIGRLMTTTAKYLEEKGYTLRSGRSYRFRLLF